MWKIVHGYWAQMQRWGSLAGIVAPAPGQAVRLSTHSSGSGNNQRKKDLARAAYYEGLAEQLIPAARAAANAALNDSGKQRHYAALAAKDRAKAKALAAWAQFDQSAASSIMVAGDCSARWYTRSTSTPVPRASWIALPTPA